MTIAEVLYEWTEGRINTTMDQTVRPWIASVTEPIQAPLALPDGGGVWWAKPGTLEVLMGGVSLSMLVQLRYAPSVRRWLQDRLHRTVFGGQSLVLAALACVWWHRRYHMGPGAGASGGPMKAMASAAAAALTTLRDRYWGSQAPQPPTVAALGAAVTASSTVVGTVRVVGDRWQAWLRAQPAVIWSFPPIIVLLWWLWRRRRGF
jgi:hypothetical protein